MAKPFAGVPLGVLALLLTSLLGTACTGTPRPARAKAAGAEVAVEVPEARLGRVRSAEEIVPEIEAAQQELTALFPSPEDWSDQAKRDANGTRAAAAIHKLLKLYPELTRSPEVAGGAELGEAGEFLFLTQLAVLGDKEAVTAVEKLAASRDRDEAALGQSVKLAVRWYRAGNDPGARAKAVRELGEAAERFDFLQRDPLALALSLMAQTTRPGEKALRAELRRIFDEHMPYDVEELDLKFRQTDRRLALVAKGVAPAAAAAQGAREEEAREEATGDEVDDDEVVVRVPHDRPPGRGATRREDDAAAEDADDDDGAPAGPSNLAAVTARSAATLAQVQFMRQALKEVALEEAARKKADAAVARAEAELKAIIKDADENPRAPLEPIRAKVREAKRAGHKELQAVLSEEQLRALADRAQKIALQATFLASPPEQLVQTLSKMNPTKEQSERIRAFAAAEAAEVRKVTTDPDRTHRQMLDDMDRMAEVALAARAELRTILTEEQFRRFDTGFSLDVPDEQAAGAAAGAERPGPAGDRARAPKGAGPSEPRPPPGK